MESKNSALGTILGTILGEDYSKLEQKAVTFRIDSKTYKKLNALQSIAPNGVSRNQLLNELLAVAISEVETSLPVNTLGRYQQAIFDTTDTQDESGG